MTLDTYIVPLDRLVGQCNADCLEWEHEPLDSKYRARIDEGGQIAAIEREQGWVVACQATAHKGLRDQAPQALCPCLLRGKWRCSRPRLWSWSLGCCLHRRLEAMGLSPSHLPVHCAVVAGGMRARSLARRPAICRFEGLGLSVKPPLGYCNPPLVFAERHPGVPHETP